MSGGERAELNVELSISSFEGRTRKGKDSLSHDEIHPFFQVCPTFFQTRCRSESKSEGGREERRNEGRRKISFVRFGGALFNRRLPTTPELDPNRTEIRTYGGP